MEYLLGVTIFNDAIKKLYSAQSASFSAMNLTWTSFKLKEIVE